MALVSIFLFAMFGPIHMNRKLVIVFIISLLIVSCNTKKERAANTYFGGEIVNPKNSHIVIFKDGVMLDSVPLREDNTFLYQFENPTSGIHTFKHNEYQMFYLHEGDSLMVRVNTMDFDESLHYSGYGAKANNFLIQLYLQNEQEIKNLENHYLLTPREFSKKIDSLDVVHKAEIEKFVKKYKPSEDFVATLKSSITYNEYLKKEMYTSVFNRNPDRVANEDFPEDFYDYRSKLDFGNNKPRSFYPYYKFLDIYFDNLTYPRYKGEMPVDRTSFVHNKEKIKIIDSLVKDDSLKNNLIRRNARRYLLAAKDPENGRKMVEILKEYDPNPKHQKEIETLAKATIRLTPGQKVPNVLLVNSENEGKNLREVLNKQTVLYFWSMESVKHFKDIHSKVAELSSKYPEFEFIGINTDTHYKKWLQTVKMSGFNKEKEFQLEDIQNAERRLVLTSNNKALIIKKNGEILESNTNLFNPSIEDQLLAFLNQ
jgi:peroxiredoxin